MTLALSVQTHDSIWLVADRRLSAPNQNPTDDAIKIANVETTDGCGIFGYAGLGATALKNAPSDWIASVLRGHNVPMRQALQILADAMAREFPKHLRQIGNVHLRVHDFIVPTIIDGRHGIYRIATSSRSPKSKFLFTKLVMGGSRQIPIPITVAGTGSHFLLGKKDWCRPLLNLVNAYNAGRIPSSVVSKRLASICFRSHQNTDDGTVGPNCIVVCKNSKYGSRGGGGGPAYFEKTTPVNGPILPTVVNGMNLSGIIGVVTKEFSKDMGRYFAAIRRGDNAKLASPSINEVNEMLAKLPSKPYDKLK